MLPVVCVTCPKIIQIICWGPNCSWIRSPSYRTKAAGIMLPTSIAQGLVFFVSCFNSHLNHVQQRSPYVDIKTLFPTNGAIYKSFYEQAKEKQYERISPYELERFYNGPHDFVSYFSHKLIIQSLILKIGKFLKDSWKNRLYSGFNLTIYSIGVE